MKPPKDGKHAYDKVNCAVCGKEFYARRDSIKKGMGKYCSHSCDMFRKHRDGIAKCARKREKHHGWIGSIITYHGYRHINTDIDHPRKYRGMYVPEHILIAERIMCRFLESNEVVHHIDGNRLNNSPTNLSVITRSYHTHIHKLNKTQECYSLADSYIRASFRMPVRTEIYPMPSSILELLK